MTDGRDLPEGRAEPVSLSSEFLDELGELLERHGHVPVSGASVWVGMGWASSALVEFIRAVRAAPRVVDDPT